MLASGAADRFDAVLGSGRGSDRPDEPPDLPLGAPLERLRMLVDWANQKQLTPSPVGISRGRAYAVWLRPLSKAAAEHPFRLSIEPGRMRFYGLDERHEGTAILRAFVASEDGGRGEYVGLVVGCELSNRWRLLLDDRPGE